MMQTLNKHVKWREDNGAIFICDCKRLIDLKIDYKYKKFIKKLNEGINLIELDNEERKVFSDFEKMRLLSNLEIKTLSKKDFKEGLKILDKELGKNRVRNEKFLLEKFKKYHQFFAGIFLDNELIGVIFGFPREDYFLISEIAVDGRFRRRGFGKKLVQFFEETVRKEGYSKINVGSEDDSIGFYLSLKYKPFLLIQFEDHGSLEKRLRDLKIINSSKGIIEANVEKADIRKIKELRKKFPNANFQYIFTKTV